jgi:hypothetical protein
MNNRFEKTTDVNVSLHLWFMPSHESIVARSLTLLVRLVTWVKDGKLS